jgi:hypothetical protein
MYEFATEDNQRYDTWVFFCGIFRIVNTDLSWAGCTSLPRKIIRGTRPFFSGIVRIVNTDSDMIEAFSECGLGPVIFSFSKGPSFCALLLGFLDQNLATHT